MNPSAPSTCLLACALLSVAGPAHAFCRTTTSEVPADYDPSVSGCWPEGLPLYWANACVSYDLQQNASAQISYDDAATGLATAFSKWTGTVCTDASGASGRVSIDVRDLGPVACDLIQYNENGPNQHAIIFRDSEWPYDDSSNTLALTTVTYDTVTGEIYDADMEINTHDQTLSIAPAVPENGFDFESIVTHETGHFLGMAHSEDSRATMYAHYTQGDEVMRDLAIDDLTGICTIYGPDGNRSVAPAAATSGFLREGACDPTPRHGFTTQCMSTGCAMSRRATAPTNLALAVVGGAALLADLRRRRRRTI